MMCPSSPYQIAGRTKIMVHTLEIVEGGQRSLRKGPARGVHALDLLLLRKRDLTKGASFSEISL